MLRTLSYLNVGKAEWCQSRCVLVASGVAVGTGRNVNLALSSSAGALLVTGSLLWSLRVYYREQRP